MSDQYANRTDEWEVGVTLDGRDLGTWDKATGGEVDSEEGVYKPGGMGARISLGGSQTVGNVTVSRIYELDRDHVLVHWLMTRAGKGWLVVKKQPLDHDGNAYGDAITIPGRLKQVHPPEPDSEGTDGSQINSK